MDTISFYKYDITWPTQKVIIINFDDGQFEYNNLM